MPDGGNAGQDRGVVVTGAARGIGRAVARDLAAMGYRVYALDINAEGLAETADGAGLAGQAAVDLTDPEAVEVAVADATATVGGRLHGLVHIAGGTAATRVPFFDITPEVFAAMVDRNLTSAFLVGQACARRMVEHGGSIVLTSSIGARFAFPGLAHYVASKGGVQQLTHAMALELGPFGIRVNAIAPGSVLTPGNREFMDGTPAAAEFLARTPLGRLGDVSEVVGSVHFLLSDLSAYTTATTVGIDGGYPVA